MTDREVLEQVVSLLITKIHSDYSIFNAEVITYIRDHIRNNPISIVNKANEENLSSIKAIKESE